LKKHKNIFLDKKRQRKISIKIVFEEERTVEFFLKITAALKTNVKISKSEIFEAS